MTISYQTIKDCHTSIKFAPGLVLGFMTTAGENETRYALYADGLVLQSEPVSIYGAHRNNFTHRGCQWTVVAEIPGEAQFIGNYPPPLNSITSTPHEIPRALGPRR